MSTQDRRRRPLPERTQPIRTWNTIAGGGSPPPAAGGDADPAPASTARRMSDAVATSVELGYRVIDDYLQQGQRIARRLSDGRPAPDVLGTELQDAGVRLARYASDFLAAWMDLLDLTARSGAPGAGPTAAPPAAPGPPPHPAPPAPADGAPHARVRVAVHSAQPVTIAVDYRPDRLGATGVRAHALRAPDPTRPRIDSVSFAAAPESEAPLLTLHIPDGHPPGSYEGLLVDVETNRPVGSVRVDIAAPEASRVTPAPAEPAPRRSRRGPRRPGGRP